MNILQVNKFYHIVGGVDRYFFSVSDLLEKKGHTIGHFSTKRKADKYSKWQKYFTDEYDFSSVSVKKAFKLFPRMIYSIDAKQKINKILNDHRWDIVHLHDIFHHLSPSILPEIKKRNIPIVQTIGDYHLISPNYNMFHKGKICEITRPNAFYKAVFHKCVKDSYIATFAEVIEKYIQYTLGWERDYIDYFIAPSKFMKNKLIEYGISSKKIIHLPYFVNCKEKQINKEKGKYVLYFGRISPEKGLQNLIKVFLQLPKIPLKIVGVGNYEYEKKLRNLAGTSKNIQFLGFRYGRQLKEIIGNCRFSILPSIWNEVFGLSILESFAAGKPVISANIGGIPEVIKDQYTGLLFESGNVKDLSSKVVYLWNNPDLILKMGENARKDAQKNFDKNEHYEKLMDIYKLAMKIHS